MTKSLRGRLLFCNDLACGYAVLHLLFFPKKPGIDDFVDYFLVTVDVQLCINSAYMCLRGTLADSQAFGNEASVSSHSKHFKHFDLART